MTLADLKIEGVEDYQSLASIEILETAHTHGICQLSFVMKKKFMPEKIIKFAKKKITVKSNEDKIIFCGLIVSYRAENRAGILLLFVTAETLSCQLKLSEKKSCTFQKADKTFSVMIGDLKKNYSDADFSYEKDRKVSALFYRKNLTDWEFLRELAESQGQILFADSKSDRLRVSIGAKSFKDFPEDKTVKLLRQSIALDFFKRLEQNTYQSARATYFVDTEILSSNPEIGVGSSVSFNGKKQVVIASHIFLSENILYNEIKLRPQEGCRAEAFDVTNYFDRSYFLTGTVLESKDNDVKVQFDCDDKQDKNDALKIPYESQVSNYLYTMPDEKDKVFVYFDNLRQAAMGSLRTKAVSDDAKNKSFKIKDASMKFDSEKISFDAAEKSEIKQSDGIDVSAKKDILFSAQGDIYIQSSAGIMPDNQITMAVAHMAGYAQYLAGLGQPATVQFNPAGSTLGTAKPAGTAKEAVELSDLAKELNKITNTQAKQAESQNSGGGSGGTVKFKSQSSIIWNVESSSIEFKGSKTNIKTRVLSQLGYTPASGGGTGSGGIAAGSPDNRPDKIKVQAGTKDRSRQKENIPPTQDNKNISA